METINIHRYNPPQWFREADFGIFIHWGPSSIPAFAPVEVDDYAKLMREKPPEYMFKISHTPIGTKTACASKAARPTSITKSIMETSLILHSPRSSKNRPGVLMLKAGRSLQASRAKYVVVVSKHHDGFVMYDTKVENPRYPATTSISIMSATLPQPAASGVCALASILLNRLDLYEKAD